MSNGSKTYGYLNKILFHVMSLGDHDKLIKFKMNWILEINI